MGYIAFGLAGPRCWGGLEMGNGFGTRHREGGVGGEREIKRDCCVFWGEVWASGRLL